MKLIDIAPVDVWQRLAQEIYDKFGFNGGIVDKDGVVVHPPAGWANKICPAIKFVIPIFVNEEFLGTAGGCGIFIEGGELDDFYISKLLHIEEEQVKKLMETVKTSPIDKLEAAVEFVQNRIKELTPSSVA